jgi:hypothetical protein
MSVLVSVILLLTLAHFIYESILAPSFLLKIRYEAFALRDDLRLLKMERGDTLDDRHYEYLQDSINTLISNLPRFDVATLGLSERVYSRDPEFRQRVDERARLLENCAIPEAKNFRHRNVALAEKAILVNSGMLVAPLIPLILTGVGFSALKQRIRKFASLSEPDFHKVGLA